MTTNSKRTAGTCYCDISFPNIGLTSGLFLRYGWNCRTQTHKPDHAKKLNVRLCFPFSVRNWSPALAPLWANGAGWQHRKRDQRQFKRESASFKYLWKSWRWRWRGWPPRRRGWDWRWWRWYVGWRGRINLTYTPGLFVYSNSRGDDLSSEHV